MTNESGQVTIKESRYAELIAMEKRLKALLVAHPELTVGEKLTSAAKKYKNALSSFVKRVDEVLSSEEIKGVFMVAQLHGCAYRGPSLAKDILEVKKILGQ